MFKRLIGVILTILQISTLFVPAAFAMDRENGANAEIIQPHTQAVDDDEIKFYTKVFDEKNPDMYKVVDEDGNEVVVDEEVLSFDTQSVLLPQKYDSRDYGRVTSVKNQDPYGTCWAFSVCAAAESSLISQGYETKDSVDLSEAHLVWFTVNNYVEGSDNPVQQDRYALNVDAFERGGNSHDATATVKRGSGFTTEEQYPYDHENKANMMFSADDMFVSNYKIDSSVNIGLNDANKVKQAIMSSGALYMPFKWADSGYGSDSDGEDNYYFDGNFEEYIAGHAVAVIGWDDNYSADNFRSKPAGNGAWLVKNSWGEYGGNYFWMSYYEPSLSIVTQVTASPAIEGENIYQYDGLMSYGAMSSSVRDTLYAANIFTAESEERVTGCGFDIFNRAHYKCTVSLYKNPDPDNPRTGTLLESKTTDCYNFGYYTLDFDNEHILQPGESFSIVIEYKNLSGSDVYIQVEKDDYNYDYASEKGQSFFSKNGKKWIDLNDKKDCDNVTIKAFTRDSNCTDHIWGDWTTATEPVDGNNGSEIRVCSVCSAQQTRSIPYKEILVHDHTGVNVEFFEKLPENSTLKVELTGDEEFITMIENLFNVAEYRPYNISVVNGGVESFYNSKVKVRIPLPDGFDEKRTVVFGYDKEQKKFAEIGFMVSDGFIEFETEKLTCFAVIEKTPAEKDPVKMDDVSLIYDQVYEITVRLDLEADVETISFESSDTSVVTVDENGFVTAVGRGEAEITCTVTDKEGNTETGTCTISVEYTFWQWIIKIVLFGWLWY